MGDEVRVAERAGGIPGEIVEVSAGERLFEEGADGEAMYLIEDGRVQIWKRTGERQCLLASLSPGEFFGEMAVLEGHPRTATAQAVTDCRLVRVDGERLEDLVASRPDVATRMLRRLSKRLREITDADARMASIRRAVDPEAVLKGRLVHAESGSAFPLSPGDHTTVGRIDSLTGRKPDVDLAPVDPLSSVSRMHATILYLNQRFVVCEPVPSANGTLVDGRRIGIGEQAEIEDGAEVVFGRVTTRFEVTG